MDYLFAGELLFVFTVFSGIAKVDNATLISYPIPLNGECGINVTASGLGEPQPLIVRPNSTEFITTDSHGMLHFKFGEKMELICPNKFASPAGAVTKRNLLIQCYQGTQFLHGDTISDIKDFNCTRKPWYDVRRTNITCDELGATLNQIGFEFEKRFLQLIDVCHNEKLGSTLYSHYKLYPGAQNFQRSVKRPGFAQGSFYDGLNMNRLYSQSNQKNIFMTLLGSPFLTSEGPMKHQLTRGHLAAKVDFIFGLHQRATHHYINTAPQWFSLNAGNWLKIENAMRKMVSDRQIEVEIYSGTLGVMTHPDRDGNSREIYLAELQQIPAPKFFYRVLYHPGTSAAVVFIRINNPFLTLNEIQKDYIICRDISRHISWMYWKPADISAGYSYVCEFSEFVLAANRHTEINVKNVFI